MWRWLQSLRGDRPPLSVDELRRRRRDGIVILFIAILFAVFAALETGLETLRGSDGSVSGNITFFLLINFNLILLILLIFLVIRNLVKLVLERRRHILGSRLRTRLVAAFVGLTLFPAILLFVVAQGFLGRVFDTWFSVRVSNSLSDALEIVDTTYQQAGNSALHFAKVLSDQIEEKNLARPAQQAALTTLLEKRRAEYDLAFAEAYDLSGAVIARAGDTTLGGERGPEPQELAGVLRGEPATATIRYRKGDVIRGAVPLENREGRVTGAVAVGYVLGRSLREPARDIAKSYEEFRHFDVLRQPVKNSYILSLLLITLVIIFSATWFGFQLAGTITGPIQRLAEGTREVAQGNWDYRIEAGGDQELATLVDSFNRMTGELKNINDELEDGRRYTETILANVAAGVVAIGPTGEITTLNRAAESMLGLRGDVRRQGWEDVFQRPDLRPVGLMIGRVAKGEEDEVQTQVKLSSGQRVITALVTVTVLRDDDGTAIGTMLFFEDVSHLRRVERMEAWREVARRIAHEIKNPLTPIQLSAQRLRKRYLGALGDKDGEVFDECTRTIVRQVDELKRLVNEFASFARLPPAHMQPHDLNEVVDEALVLFREAHRDIGFVFTPGRDLPPIEIDREAVTRAIINLLDNAVAACSGGDLTEAPRIELRTEYKERLGVVQVEVADNGPGIAPEMRGRLFEPYASTKKDGTGLGLAIVSAIAADHQAYVRVRDNDPRGTRFVIEFPLRRREDAPRVARA
jgi:two-component system, NtrC family, nitrogen regulation sensor histidine kinase NtrY